MPSTLSRKRKAVVVDTPEANEVALSDGSDDGELEFVNNFLSKLGDELSGSDDDESENTEEVGEEEKEEELETDDLESDSGEESVLDGELKTNRHTDGGRDQSPTPYGSTTNYTLTKDANGNMRYVYHEIEPAYDSDDSDAPITTNTIGDIPLSFYDSYPHIGYDINGKKITRPATGQALDSLLDSIDVPEGWTGLTDPATGKPLELSREELEILKRIQMNEIPVDGFDLYPDTIPYFTDKTEMMPLNAAPEPKRRFVPSKHEAKRVMKIVKAIREGRILPYRPRSKEEDQEQDSKRYDIWADEAPRPDHIMNLPAPKLPPPAYDESYHPPPEYLPTAAEMQAWLEAEAEDKDKDYLPTSHDSLRRVPGYERFIKEKFERCLDLYLAPRIRRTKHQIDPESLLPKLPSPEELRPFPTTCAATYRGHEGRIRSLCIDPSGIWLATGGDDGTVRVWEILTGRQVFKAKLSNSPVLVVRWRPDIDSSILAATTGTSVYILVPPVFSSELVAASHSILDVGWGYSSTLSKPSDTTKTPLAPWKRPEASSKLFTSHVFATITLPYPAKTLSWHRRGDYFVTVSPSSSSSSSSTAIAIHTLSKHLTQHPFRRLKGLPQTAHFHPSKPILFVATQRSIRTYDLAQQALLSIIQPGAKWISSFDVHPIGGTNLIVGSYDKRLLWHDLELSQRPYKTLRYHEKAVRDVRFHRGGLPLFASCGDDGSLQIFHARVDVGGGFENVSIVPLKVLKGHKVMGGLGVLEVEWHGREPWCVSAGGDGLGRLWK